MSFVEDINNYGYNGTNWHPVRIDLATRSWQTIEYEHHEIHSGSSFTCHYNNDCTNTGEGTAIAFKTPNTTKWIHVLFEASSTAGAYMAIYEDADLDLDEGTDLAIYNRDRNSSTASTVLTIETAAEAGKATSYTEAQLSGATLSTATELERHYLGVAAAGADVSGLNRGNAEFILKQNTVYAFCVFSTSNDDNTHNLTLNWYEHTNQAT